MCSKPLITQCHWGLVMKFWLPIDSVASAASPSPNERWGLLSVLWAPHLWEIRFNQRAASPHPRENRYNLCAASPSSTKRWVYPVCSEPLINKRLCLASGQPAPHPREMRFSQCAVSPSSLIDEDFPVCNTSPSSPIVDVYPACSQPLISERWGLASVQWAPHPREMRISQYATPAPHPREMRCSQCAVSPSSPSAIGA